MIGSMTSVVSFKTFIVFVLFMNVIVVNEENLKTR